MRSKEVSKRYVMIASGLTINTRNKEIQDTYVVGMELR
jgi:hypothetical protein